MEVHEGFQGNQTKIDSMTEGAMLTPQCHARAVYFIVPQDNLVTKLYFPKFPTCRNCPALPYTS